MPLVKIHLVEGRDPAAVRALADTIHEVVVETFAAPERDRYQIIHEHPRANLILLDTGLGIERGDGVVPIEITQQGRDEARKEALYRRLAKVLSDRGSCDRPRRHPDQTTSQEHRARPLLRDETSAPWRLARHAARCRVGRVGGLAQAGARERG